MRGQTVAQAIALVLMSGILAACSGGGPTIGNGSGGGSGSGSSSSSSSSSGSGSSSGSVTGQVAAHLILIPSSSTLSSNAAAGSAGSTVTLTATVTDANNVIIPGYPVTFVASAGVLTPNAAVTDVSGNITATLTAGAASAGTTIKSTATAATLTATASVLVSSTTPSYSLGILSSTGSFTANSIAVGQTPLAAGGSSGLQVSIVDTANSDTPFSGSATVSFSSPCQSQGLATITSPITSSTGTFSTTYTATGCSGNDVITATAVIGTTSLSATGTINVQPATLGSIVFVSATPTTVGLQGTGLPDSSTVLFTVEDSNGNPVQNQQVNFSLTTTAGGLIVSPGNAKSNSLGQVQTTVESGSVHTTVRVIATVSGTSLITESSELTVSTGIPTQNGISLVATTLNIVGDNFDGNTSIVTARLLDRYQNPVPDGTSVAFTTECGGIQPSCTTTGGACSVTFTTENPRTRNLAFPASSSSGSGTPASPTYLDNNCAATSAFNGGLGCDDHRCTVTAYAIGEESFTDCNGTGDYVSVQNPANNATQCPNGDFFVSLPDVFFDYNESGIFNGDFEPWVDYGNKGTYQQANGLFIGLLCDDATDPLCDTTQNELNVSQQLVIIMSNPNLNLYVSTADPRINSPIDVYNYVPPTCSLKDGTACNVSSLSIALGDAKTIWVSAGDTALQAPAVGTVLSASMNNGGSVLTPSSFTLPDGDGFGYITYSFSIQAPTTSTSCTDTLIVSGAVPPFSASAGLTTVRELPVTYSGCTPQ